MGTRATVESGIYDRKIPDLMPDACVMSTACPLLVPLVEEGWLKRRETRMIVKKYLKPLKDRQIDTLVMGCTHYPLLKDVIKAKAGKRIVTVDPSLETAVAVRDYLRRNGLVAGGENMKPCVERYFVSDIAPATAEIASRFMGRRLMLEKV
jgi:glutamate racemase